MDIYHYENYKEFLNEKISELPKKGRGVKGKLALALRCQTSYVSQVLGGNADFSLEQCYEVTKFFHIHGDEKEYFLTLAQYNRAGNFELESYFKEKLEALKEKRLTLHKRLKKNKKLNLEDSAQYFSSWMYAAVHVLLTIEGKQDVESISQYLNLPKETIAQTLSFLEQKGLATQVDGKFIPGQTTLHLDKTSPFIRQHHINWRHQAIRSIDRHLDKNLHYSSVVSVSKKDAQIIKDESIKFITHIKSIVSESSTEEELRGFNLDFFQLD
jgi:uncharacterized protein (TIGR02147 family)